MVTSPKNVQIPVSMCGDVKLSVDLLLKDVFFIPNFKFNLISVVALITDSQYMVHLFPDDFIIQDIRSKKMIGKGEKLEGLYVLNSLSLGHVLASDHFSAPHYFCINTVTTQI